jgi:hypothetical protein
LHERDLHERTDAVNASCAHSVAIEHNGNTAQQEKCESSFDVDAVKSHSRILATKKHKKLKKNHFD